MRASKSIFPRSPFFCVLPRLLCAVPDNSSVAKTVFSRRRRGGKPAGKLLENPLRHRKDEVVDEDGARRNGKKRRKQDRLTTPVAWRDEKRRLCEMMVGERGPRVLSVESIQRWHQ